MTNTDEPPRRTWPLPYVMDAKQAELLGRLSEDYADAVAAIRDRTPQSSVPVLLQVAGADLEGLEATLLMAARMLSARTGKPLLTFKNDRRRARRRVRAGRAGPLPPQGRRRERHRVWARRHSVAKTQSGVVE